MSDLDSGSKGCANVAGGPSMGKSTGSGGGGGLEALATSEREQDDNYKRVVGYFSERNRLIECKDRIQWITQVRYGNRWRNGGFFRSKAGLKLYCKDHPIIDALPDWFPCDAR
jgi:hypothetical protein